MDDGGVAVATVNLEVKMNTDENTKKALDKAHIEELLDKAVLVDLDGVEFVVDFTVDELANAYNGIGPEWFPSELREKSTGLFSLFEPAALIHDMRNHMSDGTLAKFHEANREFLANCLKLANNKYGVFSWRRYRARAVAYALFDFVESYGGWVAWQEAGGANGGTRRTSETSRTEAAAQ